MKRRCGGAGAAPGFTLVEMLVALTLLALLTVLLASLVTTGRRAAAAGEARLDDAAQLVLAESFIREQLGGMLPVALPGAGRIAFDGRPDGIAFIGLPPAALAPGGFHHLSLAVEATATGQILVLRWMPLSGGGAADARPTVLLDRLERVDFAYYGALDDASPPQWWEEWHSPTRLPSAIRLHFLFRDQRSVPDLVATIHLAQSALRNGVSA